MTEASQAAQATARLPVSPAVRDALRVKKAEKGVTYDQLLRSEFNLHLE